MFLQIIGTAGLLAVGAVVMPYSWMNALHQYLGMGTFPAEPIVGYLARSTSAFYAFFGGLLWLASFDLPHYRLVLIYTSAATILFGSALLIIDLLEDMPIWWSLSEGPINAAFGLFILILSFRRDQQL